MQNVVRLGVRRFFIFIFFKIVFYRNIFSISQFTGLYPYRLAEGRQGAYRPSAGRAAPCRPLPGGRDLYVIKIWVLSHGGPYRPIEGRQAGRPPGRGTTGCQAPPNIKAEVPPHLHLQQTTSIEGKRRDVGWGRELQQRSPTGFWIRTAGNQYFSTLSF